MFKKLSVLLLALPVISALQLAQPTTQVRSESPFTATWTLASGDPATFDLYLTNDNFRNTFALKNTVTTSDGNVTVVIPVVTPGPGYALRASPVGDVTTALSVTSTFEIGEHISSSSSLPSSTSSGNGTLSPTISRGSTSGFGSTISGTSTPSSGSGSSTRTSPSTTPSGSFNGGSNGAVSVAGISATIVGVFVAAGAFLGL